MTRTWGGWSVTLLIFLGLRGGAVTAEETTVLATGGTTFYRIVLPTAATDVERLAAAELAKYLELMSGATFPVVADRVGRRAANSISIATAPEPGGHRLDLDEYRIRVAPGSIVLTGVNGRSTLYAAYQLLESLGCRWFAPNFDFYGVGGGEYVPRLDTLRLATMDRTYRASLRFRKKYVEEGRSHDLESLRKLIEWMPKARLNTFNCPLNHQGRGKAGWDRWRADLLPDLRRRDLLLEVGGHGYETFLPVDEYFDAHPEWFGLWQGKRSRDRRVVFETSNADAMRQFTDNVARYLRAHPEIDILDLWPPDSARWSESAESKELGSDRQRHSLIVNAVARMVKSEFPRVLVEFIAYQTFKFPPEGTQFADNTLVDLCPGSRSYESPIWDVDNARNAPYVKALKRWLDGTVYRNDVSIQSYYRKYAWRSLPVVIPRLIAAEIRFYESMGVNGLGSYSEVGDWFTYELNHLVTARASWNAEIEIDDFLWDYCQKRFGPSGALVCRYFEIIEDVVPSTAKIPGTEVDDESEVSKGLEMLQEAGRFLDRAEALVGGYQNAEELIGRLKLSLRYAQNDLEIRRLAWYTAASAGRAERAIEFSQLLRERLELFTGHQGEGLFLIAPPYTNYGTLPREPEPPSR